MKDFVLLLKKRNFAPLCLGSLSCNVMTKPKNMIENIYNRPLHKVVTKNNLIKP